MLVHSFHMSARFVSWPRAVALAEQVRDVSPVEGSISEIVLASMSACLVAG